MRGRDRAVSRHARRAGEGLALAITLATSACAATPLPPAAAPFGSKQADARECRTAADCELVSRSCCGHCGQPASGDVRAVRAGHARTPARCVGAGCPRCHADPDPALVPLCTSAGRCAVLDLHRSPLTACTTDADCRVRPRGCCACGASEWVAIRADADAAYTRRVCGAATACPECVGDEDGGLRPVCVDAHCETRGGSRAEPPLAPE